MLLVLNASIWALDKWQGEQEGRLIATYTLAEFIIIIITRILPVDMHLCYAVFRPIKVSPHHLCSELSADPLRRLAL